MGRLRRFERAPATSALHPNPEPLLRAVNGRGGMSRHSQAPSVLRSRSQISVLWTVAISATAPRGDARARGFQMAPHYPIIETEAGDLDLKA